MTRRLWCLFALLAACESKPSAPAATSANVSDDTPPAIEVKPQAPPKFSLSKLDEKALSGMLGRTGFSVTVVGHTPSGGESAIKVGGYKKDGENNLECTVVVRCPAPATPSYDAGTAYFSDAGCVMTAEVRRGIRKKSAESQRLLEQILAG